MGNTNPNNMMNSPSDLETLQSPLMTVASSIMGSKVAQISDYSLGAKMNQVMQWDNYSASPALPVKRKRGRPRKDKSLKHVKTAHVPPVFEALKENSSKKDTRVNENDARVGEAVMGVVEAIFDAGYLLTVRIGNSTTNLRGVVFKPGHYVPVTVENDVAPHVEMIRRNEVHLPAGNQTGSRGNSSVPQTASLVVPKCKYSSPKAAPASSVEGGGPEVLVVLQPVGESTELLPSNKMPAEAFKASHAMALGERDVQTAESLAMLPPDQSIPFSQILTATSQAMLLQPQSSVQVEQGSVQNESGQLTESASDAQGEEDKLVRLTDLYITDSLQSSKSDTGNGKEARISSAEDFVVISEQDSGNRNEPFLTRSQTESGFELLHSEGSGRMSELLQALQENIEENQVPSYEPLTS
ncbi:Uncharacterized protein Adt_08750 [Abeliophyllum distichum]|uniref:AT hook motif-containing protein n=1 Tax=Abeliophyllum distichum TaxID=126358 RepID=A0ABD1UF87_9LAMI